MHDDDVVLREHHQRVTAQPSAEYIFMLSFNHAFQRHTNLSTSWYSLSQTNMVGKLNSIDLLLMRSGGDYEQLALSRAGGGSEGDAFISDHGCRSRQHDT